MSEGTPDIERQRQGATCRALREKTGLKLGEAANHLDVSYAYLSNIEAGRKPLTAVLLAKMAALYDVRQIAIARPDLFEKADPEPVLA
jgi:transcriptional regulator with XRE-family HTH domain